MVAKQVSKTRTKAASGVKKNFLTEVTSWIHRYGCKPSQTHPLGKQLLHSDLTSAMTTRIAELRVMKKCSIKKADRFMEAIAKNKTTKLQRIWAAQMKARQCIVPTSLLGQCLSALPSHGRPKAPAMAGVSVAKVRSGSAELPKKMFLMALNSPRALSSIGCTRPQLMCNLTCRAC